MRKGQPARLSIRNAARLVAALGAVLILGSTTPAAADPPEPSAATEVAGCCLCRGTNGGPSSTLRSCTDGLNVTSCTAQCKGQNADGMAFGFNQTCSQGCAGFPTQGLQ